MTMQPGHSFKPSTQRPETINQASASSGFTRPASIRGDSEEWFGLGYALEVSKIDVAAPTTQYAEGQYSKSREAWAILHRPAVDLAREEEDFERWKAWHRRLEEKDNSKHVR
ncbi:hypothetical protein OH77DRAFT_1520023 [Trametes cingulata]|nr:hypothetical protein OH77DRAFT_1520023 [Trametes cingulata]